MNYFKKTLVYLLITLTFICTYIQNTTCNVSTDGPSGDYYIQYAHNQEGSNRYVYIWKLCYAGGDPEKVGQKIADPGEMDWSEGRIYEAIAFYNYLTYDYLVSFLNDGFMTEYIDEFIIVGRLPEGFTLNASSADNKTETETPVQEQSKPETKPSQKPSDTDKKEDAASSDKEQTQKPSAEKEPVLNTEFAGTYVVVDSETKSYSNYKTDTELKTWGIGTHLQVEGLLSNGFYKALAEDTVHYIDKSHLVPLAEYEKAWLESSKTESECEKPGSITYTNAISNETKTEETKALEHDYKEVETIKPTCEEDGRIKSECILCNKETAEIIDAKGHVFKDSLIEKGNPLTHTHVKKAECTVCDKSVAVDLWELSIWKIAIEVVVGISILIVCIFVIKRKHFKNM